MENSYLQPADGSTISIRDIYNILFRRKFVIVVVFLATVFTVVGGVYMWPETYEARSSLLIKLGREHLSASMVTPIAQQSVVSMGLRKEDINSEVAILKNRFIAEQVRDELGTDFLFPAREVPKTFLKRVKYEVKRAVSKVKNGLLEVLYWVDLKRRLSLEEKAVVMIQKNLSANQLRNSDVIEVRFNWFSPVIAEKVLSTVNTLFLENHLDIRKNQGSYVFIKEQVKEIKDRLSNLEDEVQRIKEEQQIFTYDEQKSLLLTNLVGFQTALQNTATELTETYSRIDELKRQMATLVEAITPGFEVAYKAAETNLMLQEVNEKALVARKKKLESHILEGQQELDKLDRFGLILKRLNHQIQIEEANYILYSKKMEEVRIANLQDAEKIANVRVISPARASVAPVKPRKLFLIAISMVASLIVGVGLSFVFEYLDHTIKSEEDLDRYLNLKLLGNIPESTTKL